TGVAARACPGRTNASSARSAVVEPVVIRIDGLRIIPRRPDDSEIPAHTANLGRSAQPRPPPSRARSAALAPPPAPVPIVLAPTPAPKAAAAPAVSRVGGTVPS